MDKYRKSSIRFRRYLFQHCDQSRTQSNACARARMALALGKLTTGTPKFRGSGFVGMHVKPITAQEKFNFPRANAILARAQALLWVRDCIVTIRTLLDA